MATPKTVTLIYKATQLQHGGKRAGAGRPARFNLRVGDELKIILESPKTMNVFHQVRVEAVTEETVIFHLGHTQRFMMSLHKVNPTPKKGKQK